MGLPSSFSSSSSSSVDHHMPMPSSTRYERTARIDSSSSSTPQPLRQSSDMRATDKPHRPLSSPVSSSSSSSSVSPGDNKKFPSHQQGLFLAPSSTLSQKETGEAFDKDSCEGEGRRRMEGKSGAKEQRKADKEEEEQEEGSFFMKRSSCGLSHGQLLLQEQLRRESSCFRQGRSISCDEDLLPKAFDQDEKDEKKKKKILDDDEENGSIRCVDVKIAVVGNVDSGKSTLVGVLSSRCLDDGRGLARSRIFNFPHEAATGRTSSLATEIVGFDSHGDQILPPSSSSSSHARHSQRHPHLPPPSSSSVLSSLSSSSSLHGEGSSFSRKTTHLHDVSSSSSSLKEKEKDKKNTSKKEISTRPSSSSLSQKEEDPHGDLPEMSSVRSNTPSDLGRHPLHPSFHHDSHNRNFKHTHPHPEEEEPLLHSKAESHDEKKDPGKEEGEGESISPLLKTSSSSSHSPLPSSSSTSRQVAWRAIVQEAKKIVTFLDLCGHERYLKTTVFGLVATYPDYSMVVISGNSQAGLQRMTKEHLGICLGLNLPFFVVVTKIDLTPPHVYQKTLESICKVLKHPTVKKLPIIVKREEEIGAVTKAIPSGRVCPIFCVSNVTGEHLDLLRLFLSKLPSRVDLSGLYGRKEDCCEYVIDGVYSVQGVGVVVSGTVRSGSVRPNKHLYLGPDRAGHFRSVVVRSLHYKRSPVSKAVAGQSASMCIRALSKKEHLKKNFFRKGMVLLEPSAPLRVCWEFLASVLLLHHSTTIQRGYQCVLHIGNVRQTGRVVEIFAEDREEKRDVLRTGDKGFMKFRFLQYAEYLVLNAPLLFREGRTRGLGTVCEVLC